MYALIREYSICPTLLFFLLLFIVINRLLGRVETRHKKRAYAIWAALVGVLIAYTVWVVTEAIKQRDDPSVNLALEVKTVFTFRHPTLLLVGVLCLLHGESHNTLFHTQQDDGQLLPRCVPCYDYINR